MSKEEIVTYDHTAEMAEDHLSGEFAKGGGFAKGDLVQSIGLASSGIEDGTRGEIIATDWNNGLLTEVQIKLEEGEIKTINAGRLKSLRNHFLKIDEAVDEETSP